MKKAKQPLQKMAVLAILIFTCINCNNTNKTDAQQNAKPEVLAPSQIVEIDQAKSMYDNYTSRRAPLIQRYEDSINRGNDNTKAQQQTQKTQKQEGEVKPFDVARFVSYDYKTIKQYIAYIEQEAEVAGVEISTLRFYFSNYPDKELFPGTKEELKHPRQNSILLSPTIQKGEHDHLFYITQGVDKPEAVILNDDFGTVKGMGLIESGDEISHASFIPNFFKPNVNPVYAGKSLTMNRGGSSPPPYPNQ